MAMVTEWTFTKKGRKTEAQRTRTFTKPEELDKNDHNKLQDLADFLVDWVMKSTAKDGP